MSEPHLEEFEIIKPEVLNLTKLIMTPALSPLEQYRLAVMVITSFIGSAAGILQYGDERFKGADMEALKEQITKSIFQELRYQQDFRKRKGH